MSVPSPCIGVCVLDPASGLCRGCRRSIAEIAAWPDLSEAERLAVLQAVAVRAGPAIG